MEKKFKILLGGIATFIVVAIAVVGVFLTTHSKDVNLGVNTSKSNNSQQTINTSANTQQATTVDKHQAEKSKTTKADTTSDKNDKATKTSTATNNTSNNNKDDNSLNQTKALNNPASTAKNQYEKIFYSSTFGRQVYPQILNDNGNNIIKIYTVYTLAYLNGMKTMGNDIVNGKGNIQEEKSNYYTALEYVNNSLQFIVPTINQIIKISNGTQKTEAQNLLNVVQAAAGSAEAEYKIITASTGFGIPMINSLPFGSTLDNNLSQLNTLNNNLGCDNKQQLQQWQQYANQTFSGM
ncbi:hypothetical protein [Clostridium massiliamazoniense]|uniref:hypothetical protein n=1 Tax=Clostridium massiliamazoniense TaxID=1347366 RepID=UPI0006D76CDD|nr:hypothetical protein [Clostridium massiliamazoniense]